MDRQIRPLTRRAFVRGALLTSVAAAAAAVRPIQELTARGATLVDDVPRLDVHEPVVGVAFRSRRLLAVGGHPGAPRAWSLEDDASTWAAVAGTDAFPEGTSVLDVAAQATGFLAAGWRETAEGPRPTLLSSADGSAWTLVSLPEIGHGACLAVAANDDGALAVGTTFAEPSVREPVRAVAFVADIGGSWSEVPIDELAGLRHGAITMLAAARASFLLATVDVAGSGLYASSSPSGPWRPVATPKADRVVTFVAAADTGAGVLLAGIDDLDAPRYWLEGARGWREIGTPGGIATSSHVVGLARADGSVVAAGADAAGSFVEEVTAA
jgi:hypothetical protein